MYNIHEESKKHNIWNTNFTRRDHLHLRESDCEDMNWTEVV
jgi:hypothetical protein